MADETLLAKRQKELDKLAKDLRDVKLPLLAKRLKAWRGTRNAREAATALGIPLETYRKYEWGKRTPNALAMAELERRMAETVQQPAV